MESCAYFYDPTDPDAMFILYFDQNVNEEQQKRAAKVIVHLESLDHEDLVEESIQFFKWLVQHRLSLEHQHYCQSLLDYFHSKGLLELKQSVVNPIKQLKRRYCVVYSMGGHTFTTTYNSIREIKADTGKKPSQIKRQNTKDVMCAPL